VLSVKFVLEKDVTDHVVEPLLAFLGCVQLVGRFDRAIFGEIAL